MIYDFVRLIVFFDLPMVTKKDVRAYNDSIVEVNARDLLH